MDHDLLTVAEAAALVRAHPATVRRWIAQGQLKALRRGKRRLFVRRQDLLMIYQRCDGTMPETRKEAEMRAAWVEAVLGQY